MTTPSVRAPSRRGTVRVHWPSRDVMCTFIEGHCDEAMAQVHMREARTAYDVGRRVHHFFDVEGLTGYDSAARVALTRFAIDHRAFVASAVFLVKNRIVAMGVSTAALAARLAGLEFVVVSTRAELDARMRAPR